MIRILIFALLSGIVSAMLAGYRGDNKRTGFILGAVLGPFGVAIVFFMAGIRCPHCRHQISSKARICRVCSTPLVARDSESRLARRIRDINRAVEQLEDAAEGNLHARHFRHQTPQTIEDEAVDVELVVWGHNVRTIPKEKSGEQGLSDDENNRPTAKRQRSTVPAVRRVYGPDAPKLGGAHPNRLLALAKVGMCCVRPGILGNTPKGRSLK